MERCNCTAGSCYGPGSRQQDVKIDRVKVRAALRVSQCTTDTVCLMLADYSGINTLVKIGPLNDMLQGIDDAVAKIADKIAAKIQSDRDFAAKYLDLGG